MNAFVKKILFGIFLLFVFDATYSQYDKLVMINGKELYGRVTKIDEQTVSLRMFKNGEKLDFDIEKYRIFAIEYEEGKRQVLYSQDTLDGRDYTVREMEYLIFGEQDAHKNHKTGLPFAVAGTLGGVGGYVVGGQNFLVLGVPFISMFSTAIILPANVKKSAMRDPKYLESKEYKKGYRRVVKTKRNKQAILGSVVGTVAGVIIRAVSKKN